MAANATPPKRVICAAKKKLDFLKVYGIIHKLKFLSITVYRMTPTFPFGQLYLPPRTSRLNAKPRRAAGTGMPSTGMAASLTGASSLTSLLSSSSLRATLSGSAVLNASVASAQKQLAANFAGASTFSGSLATYLLATSITGGSSIAAALAVPSASNFLGGVADGDSITRGYSTTNPSTKNWAAQLAGLTGKTISNSGVDGDKLESIDSGWASSGIAAQYNPASCNWYFQQAGCNDMRAGATLSQLQGWIQSIMAKAKAAGYLCAVCTILPENYVGWNGSAETVRTGYNTWLKANYSSFCDLLIDFDGIAAMADPSNTTYYTDGLHPTDAGQLLLAQCAQTALTGAPQTKPLATAISGASTIAALLSYTGPATTINGSSSVSATLATASVSSVAWSDTDHAAAITKTSATRIERATTAGGTWATARSETSKTSGRFYVEFTINNLASNNQGCIIGVANATEALTNYCGQTTNSFGVWSNGCTMIYNGNANNTFFGNALAGAILCLDIDITNKTVAVKLNGGAWSSTVSITTLAATPLFVAATLNDGAETPAVTVNFGDTAFAYTPPSGAVAWKTP